MNEAKEEAEKVINKRAVMIDVTNGLIRVDYIGNFSTIELIGLFTVILDNAKTKINTLTTTTAENGK